MTPKGQKATASSKVSCSTSTKSSNPKKKVLFTDGSSLVKSEADKLHAMKDATVTEEQAAGYFL